MPELSYDLESHKQLSFCEAYILIENVNQMSNQGMLIAQLTSLQGNTTDPRLLSELKSLLNKIKNLTPREFAKLKQDTRSGRVIHPSGYAIEKENSEDS